MKNLKLLGLALFASACSYGQTKTDTVKVRMSKVDTQMTFEELLDLLDTFPNLEAEKIDSLGIFKLKRRKLYGEAYEPCN